jgi:c-di-GMP-related signal transduction protein
VESSTFVARQPIFNQRERVFAYELLYRSGPENVFHSDDGDRASASIVDKVLTYGSDLLTGGHRTFINCTGDFLRKEYATLLPRKDTILEILETVEPDRETIGACQNLREAGYMIALDDFFYADKFQPFIELADFIKVDFTGTPLALRQELVDKFAPRGIRMLAEKVESRGEFSQAKKLGYDYFQGYFFCKPEVLTNKELPASKMHYLRILQAVSRPELDLRELGHIIEHDASLCYKLLRYLNSALFGFRGLIQSVPHALTLLGQREVKKWASVLAMVGIAEDRSPELLVSSLSRARCCELLASILGEGIHAPEFFLVGLFSLMDAILGRPMLQFLSDVALPETVRAALLGTNNRLRMACDLGVAYDQGRWEEASRLAASLRLSEDVMPGTYTSSVQWATQVFQV